VTERMIAAVGHTGYGKSTIVREIVLARDRVITLEQDARKRPEWEALGFIWYDSFAELLADLKAFNPRRFRVALVPGRSRFVDVLRLAWALGNVTVIIEEAGKYFPWLKPMRQPWHLPIASGGNMTVPGELLEICERGRHAGPDAASPVSLVFVSQRPKRIPLCVQAELDRVYAFHLALPHDRKWLAECPGATKQIAEETKNLPKYQYLNITQEGFTREVTRG
jgi:hypothetical protein